LPFFYFSPLKRVFASLLSECTIILFALAVENPAAFEKKEKTA